MINLVGFNDLLLLYADLCKNPVDGFSAGLLDDTNLFEWSVTIIGPPDTLLLVFPLVIFCGVGNFMFT